MSALHLGGITLYLNNGGGNLMGALPLHAFGWPSGVDNQFEF